MKLIVFSDLHGNSYALDIFLREIRKESYDYLIFCGDIFGYYYNQHEIIEILKRLEGMIWLKGNHDVYFQRLYDGKVGAYDFINKYGHSYFDIKNRFSEIEFTEIAKHEPEHLLAGEDCKIGIFHGTPQNPLEGRLYPRDDVTDPEVYQQFDIVILGHTHCRMERFVGNTLVVNSGSLGQPRDGNGFGYAVINTADKTVQFENIILDTTALYKQIEKYDPDLKKLKNVLERRKEEFV